ncbi:MAG: hypothetical protein M0Z76_07440 [Gammaproteobacteria bacterium]|nr:hypothetical protein [Gammaproteobacteria bacterium]
MWDANHADEARWPSCSPYEKLATIARVLYRFLVESRYMVGGVPHRSAGIDK